VEGEKGVLITLKESYDAAVEVAEEKVCGFEQAIEDDESATVDLDPVERAKSLGSIHGDLPCLVGEFGAERLVLDSASLLVVMDKDRAERRIEIFEYAESLNEASVKTMLTSEAKEQPLGLPQRHHRVSHRQRVHPPVRPLRVPRDPPRRRDPEYTQRQPLARDRAIRNHPGRDQCVSARQPFLSSSRRVRARGAHLSSKRLVLIKRRSRRVGISPHSSTPPPHSTAPCSVGLRGLCRRLNVGRTPTTPHLCPWDGGTPPRGPTRPTVAPRR